MPYRCYDCKQDLTGQVSHWFPATEDDMNVSLLYRARFEPFGRQCFGTCNECYYARLLERKNLMGPSDELGARIQYIGECIEWWWLHTWLAIYGRLDFAR